MSKERFPKKGYEQLADFRYRVRKFIHFSEKAARSIGITPKCHQLMLMIMGFPGRDYATPSELAERLQITHHSCVGLINRCEQNGLVYKTTNPEDGRSVLVRLTDKGLSILEDLSETHLQELRRIGLSGLNNPSLEDGNSGHIPL